MKKTGWRWLALLLAVLFPTAALAQKAVVDNGSDPKSKLNMREEPSRSAEALGQFYSGTVVEIVADAGGGWSQVVLGEGTHTIEGYMMTSYLKSADAAQNVLDATVEKCVVSPYGTRTVVLRDVPSDSYDAVAMLMVGDKVRVIGVSGDFCFVLLEDNCVGCLASDELN